MAVETTEEEKARLEHVVHTALAGIVEGLSPQELATVSAILLIESIDFAFSIFDEPEEAFQNILRFAQRVAKGHGIDVILSDKMPMMGDNGKVH